jgi:SNF2-related domain
MSNSMDAYIPRPYQALAETFLARLKRGNLHAEPGTGKTAVMLALVDRVLPDPVLVVAPRLVAINTWSTEALRWADFAHLHVACLAGRSREERLTQLKPLRRITVVNPEWLPHLLEHFKDRWPFKAVIWDESDRLAGFRLRQGSQRARAMSEVAFRDVTHWYNLCGTPAANSYLDLWGPQWFIDGGEALGRSFDAYTQRWFCRPPHGGLYAPLQLLPGARDVIQARLRSSTYTVRAEDWLPLHKPVEHTLTFELPAKARQAYNDMRRHLVAQMELGEVTALNAGVKADKLRQIASGRVYAEADDEHSAVEVHTERLELLAGLMHELSGQPLLVVYRWKHEAQAIQARFQACELREFGAMTAWNAGRLPMLLVHPASGGHGLNLQDGGHHLCFYTPLSDNKHYSQVIERLGPTRQLQAGYNRLVYLYHLMADHTVDAHTRAVREGRRSEYDAFMDALKA